MKKYLSLIIATCLAAIVISACATPTALPTPTRSRPPTKTSTATPSLKDLKGNWSLEFDFKWVGDHPGSFHGCAPITITDRVSFNAQGPITYHIQNVLDSIFHEGCHYDMTVHGAITFAGDIVPQQKIFRVNTIRFARDSILFNEILSEDCNGTPGPEGEWAPIAMTDGGLLGAYWAAYLKVIFDAIDHDLSSLSPRFCEIEIKDSAQIKCIGPMLKVRRGNVCEPIPTAVPTRIKTSTPITTETLIQREQPYLTPFNYVVVMGDTLDSIAQKFGTTVEEIMSLNGLESEDEIFPGMTILIPSQ